MNQKILFSAMLIIVASCAFGQGLRSGRLSRVTPEEQAKQERQRKTEREAALPKMQAALKEIAGVTLGQPESDALPRKARGEWTALQKPYRYFTKIDPDYSFGKLVGVWLYFETEGKYSTKSIEAEVQATGKDVLERLGKKMEHELRSHSGEFGNSFNGWSIEVRYNSALKAVVLYISDYALYQELSKADREAKEAKLETLPVFVSSNSVNEATEKESLAKENAKKEAERKAEEEELAMETARKEAENKAKASSETNATVKVDIGYWRSMPQKATYKATKEFSKEFLFAKDWEAGKGLSWFQNMYGMRPMMVMKFDPEGRLVKVSARTNFPELVKLDARKDEIAKQMREEYAKSLGLTVEGVEKAVREQAAPKSQARSIGSSIGGSLRERRLARQQQKDAALREAEAAKAKREAAAVAKAKQDAEEKAQREVEREEQRKQLLQIQEELKKAREAREAVEATAK